MPKIVGYYQEAPMSASSGFGAGILDLVGGQEAVNQMARNAAQAALPVIEEKLNEKLLYAGIAAGVAYVGLVALILVRTAK